MRPQLTWNVKRREFEEHGSSVRVYRNNRKPLVLINMWFSTNKGSRGSGVREGSGLGGVWSGGGGSGPGVWSGQ